MTDAYGREGDAEASDIRRNQARFLEVHGLRFQALTSRGELFAVVMEKVK